MFFGVRLNPLDHHQAGIVFIPDLAEFFQRTKAQGGIKGPCFGVIDIVIGRPKRLDLQVLDFLTFGISFGLFHQRPTEATTLEAVQDAHDVDFCRVRVVLFQAQKADSLPIHFGPEGWQAGEGCGIALNGCLDPRPFRQGAQDTLTVVGSTGQRTFDRKIGTVQKSRKTPLQFILGLAPDFHPSMATDCFLR